MSFARTAHGDLADLHDPLLLPAHQPPPLEPAGWRWEGIFVGRLWRGGLPPLQEYLLMLLAGNRLRLRRGPDKYDQAGCPIYVLSDYERRAGWITLDRQCDGQFEGHNIACDAGRTCLLDYLANSGGLTGVQYFAVGNGSSVSPNAIDTALVSEQFRKAITLTAISGDQVDLLTTFGTGDANFPYTEAGCFGNGATIAANSGQLFDHAPYNYSLKTSGIALTNNAYIYLT